jgi:hypothetical protein
MWYSSSSSSNSSGSNIRHSGMVVVTVSVIVATAVVVVQAEVAAFPRTSKLLNYLVIFSGHQEIPSLLWNPHMLVPYSPC